MAETEIRADHDGFIYEDSWGDILGVSLDRGGYAPIGSFTEEGDFIGCQLDREAVEHLRNALTDWLEG